MDQGFEVITINMEGEAQLAEAKSVLDRLNISVTNLCLAEGITDQGLAAVQNTAGLLPAINIYDREGQLAGHFEGEIDEDEVEQRITELLAM